MAPAHQQFLLGVHALMKASKMSELRMAENEDSVKSEINLADEIIAGRKCTNTKVQYGRKVEHFKKWISEVNPDCMSSDSTLNLHLIDTSQLQQFLGHICKKKNAKGEYLSPTVYQAFQHVSGYKSAIKDYYSTKNVKFSLESGRMMEHFFKGYNRKIAQMKQDGFIPLIEGKQPISFKGYKFLASKALDQLVDYNISISCHLFLVLCWNLIARCVSVGSLMYDHVSWSLDALVIVSRLTRATRKERMRYRNMSSPTHLSPPFAQSYHLLFTSLLGGTIEKDRKQVFFLERQKVGLANGYINYVQITKKY